MIVWGVLSSFQVSDSQKEGIRLFSFSLLAKNPPAPTHGGLPASEAPASHEFPLSCVPCLLGEGSESGASGEDALSRIQRLMAEGGMTAVVQREQSTTMASMGGFGNSIIVSHRIHRGSQTGAEPAAARASSPRPSASRGLLPEPGQLAERGLSPRTACWDQPGVPGRELPQPTLPSSSPVPAPLPLPLPSTEGPALHCDLTNNNHLADGGGGSRGEAAGPSREPRNR